MEYVIEAHDTDDMRSWLATVKYCMRSTQQSSDNLDSRSVFSTLTTVSMNLTLVVEIVFKVSDGLSGEL